MKLNPKEYAELTDPKWLLHLAFLTNISEHLNTLNQTLQGANKTLPTMFQSIESFQDKLTLFSMQLAVNNLTQFSHLRKMVAEVDPNRNLYKEQNFGINIDEVAKEFEDRFSECRSKKSLFQFVIDPFSFDVNKLSEFISINDLGTAQLALIELKNDTYLSRSPDVNRADCFFMWKVICSFHAYNVLCRVARRIFSMFGSTYRCESAFSAMKGIKTKDRNRITDVHLQHCVRAATTNYEPNFIKLVTDIQCQGSH